MTTTFALNLDIETINNLATAAAMDALERRLRGWPGPNRSDLAAIQLEAAWRDALDAAYAHAS